MAKKGSIPPPLPGQRVFMCGHSFHYWTPEILIDLAASAGIAGHKSVGKSVIGGSLALQHWDVPDEKNDAKKALRAGAVDVLTLSCMTHPDAGIRNFALLAYEYNPKVRVTLQELWLPEDHFPFDANNRTRTSVDQFNTSTVESLKPPHAEYFAEMEAYVNALNAEIGKQVVLIVPDAQATLALRARIIAGKVSSLPKQSDLFTDAWGHPTPPLKVLASYCHFAVIYRRSPVGLPWPKSVECPQQNDAALNRDLQTLAWQAVTQHPMSGVKA
ncbi:MAG TPA: hypothetical protein VL860_01640 [Planctomycetota bacterium]|nr:hypothetical protein [Planctomycetota bacterium]